jgi:hypothetical protein
MGQTFWEHVRNFRSQLEIIGSNFLQYGSLKRPQFPAEVEFLKKEQLSHSYKILRHSKKERESVTTRCLSAFHQKSSRRLPVIKKINNYI